MKFNSQVPLCSKAYISFDIACLHASLVIAYLNERCSTPCIYIFQLTFQSLCYFFPIISEILNFIFLFLKFLNFLYNNVMKLCSKKYANAYFM